MEWFCRPTVTKIEIILNEFSVNLHYLNDNLSSMYFVNPSELLQPILWLPFHSQCWSPGLTCSVAQHFHRIVVRLIPIECLSLQLYRRIIDYNGTS